MESLGLICLASNEPSIRIQALELLRGGRSLHRSIRAVQVGPRPSSVVIRVASLSVASAVGLLFGGVGQEHRFQAPR